MSMMGKLMSSDRRPVQWLHDSISCWIFRKMNVIAQNILPNLTQTWIKKEKKQQVLKIQNS